MNGAAAMRTYRSYILGCKRKYGTARSQVHYLDYVRAYLDGKRAHFAVTPRCFGRGSTAVAGCTCKSLFLRYFTK